MFINLECGYAAVRYSHEWLTIIFKSNLKLKGKFSSGIEGALASTLNRDFNWKQLSEMILCIFFDVFKVYLSNIDSETAEIYFF